MENNNEQKKQYFIEPNITLLNEGWETPDLDVLGDVLGCSVRHFNKALVAEYRHNIPCYITHWDNEYNFCSGDLNQHLIFLNAKNDYWGQYTYQFAHEFCHHLINLELTGNPGGALWFEEMICELASMYCVIKNAELWKTDAPYHGGSNYASSFRSYYIDNIIHRDDVPNSNLSVSSFIKENIEVLEQPDYQRGMYIYIAKGVVDIFINYPSLWNIILFFKDTKYRSSDYSGLEAFLDELGNILPSDIKGYGLLKKRLLG